MELWDLLKKDHREAEKLFARLAESDPEKEGAEIFEKLRDELRLHTKVEEEFFYPELRRHEETRDMVEEAVEEHAEVKRLLQAIDKLSPGGDSWNEKIETLQENVEHHVEEEENEVFPAAEKVLDEAQCEEIARRIEAAKKEAQAG